MANREEEGQIRAEIISQTGTERVRKVLRELDRDRCGQCQSMAEKGAEGQRGAHLCPSLPFSTPV